MFKIWRGTRWRVLYIFPLDCLFCPRCRPVENIIITGGRGSPAFDNIEFWLIIVIDGTNGFCTG